MAPVGRVLASRLERLYMSVDEALREQILCQLPRSGGLRLLDVGCGDGAFTSRLEARMGITPSCVAGVEAVPAHAALARARGYDVRIGDLEQAWPFDASSFDVVHANQVIEHVKRLDHFVLETRRVLRPGGCAIVCTENLASWHNVAALVLGYVPFSQTSVSATGPIGNPFALHLGAQNELESWQHLHVLTTLGLRAIFEAHGFRVERVFASGYYPAVGRLGAALARRDTRHAHMIGIVATPGD